MKIHFAIHAFGCEKLSVSDFTGAIICKNYVKAEADEDEERLDDMFGKLKEEKSKWKEQK